MHQDLSPSMGDGWVCPKDTERSTFNDVPFSVQPHSRGDQDGHRDHGVQGRHGIPPVIFRQEIRGNIVLTNAITSPPITLGQIPYVIMEWLFFYNDDFTIFGVANHCPKVSLLEAVVAFSLDLFPLQALEEMMFDTMVDLGYEPFVQLDANAVLYSKSLIAPNLTFIMPIHTISLAADEHLEARRQGGAHEGGPLHERSLEEKGWLVRFSLSV